LLLEPLDDLVAPPLRLIDELYDAREKSIREICEALDISKKTLYEYLKRRPTLNARG
jgi:predicted DNA-binding protein YlxM (UPF0122 family)